MGRRRLSLRSHDDPRVDAGSIGWLDANDTPGALGERNFVAGNRDALAADPPLVLLAALVPKDEVDLVSRRGLCDGGRSSV